MEYDALDDEIDRLREENRTLRNSWNRVCKEREGFARQAKLLRDELKRALLSRDAWMKKADEAALLLSRRDD